ncbi:hypothetical protein D3C80_1589780 [compost metagenome]
MTVAFLAAIEALQHRRPLLFGNPRATVLDSNVHARFVLRRRHGNTSTFGRELDTVAHQVGQRLEQQLAIAVQCR